VVADGRLRLAERLLEVARADLAGRGHQAEEPESHRVGQGREGRRQLVGLVDAQGGGEHRGAAGGVDPLVTVISKLFATEPAKRKPGYANFAIAEPPLKLVLIEGEGGGTLNHLGVEVTSGEEVRAAEARLADDGLATTGIDDTTCCYALTTETWVSDPDGAPWEVYVKTGDAEQLTDTVRTGDDATPAQCCDPAAMSEAVAHGSAPSC